jgi:DNA excision repair protein ERCC-3
MPPKRDGEWQDPSRRIPNSKLDITGAAHRQHHAKRNRTDGSSDPLSADIFTGAITARDPMTRSFPSLVLSPDAANRPLYVCPDGHIFLETFSQHYKPAYDFLIGIAEPVSRPRFVHEYQITLFSMYAAVSIGLTADEIIHVLNLLSKCKISEELERTITSTIKAVGKLRLILQDNRFFVESTDLALLQRIANDNEISKYRVYERKPTDQYDDDTGFIVADTEDGATVVPGVGDVSAYRATREFGLQPEAAAESPAEMIARRFEVRASRVRSIRQRALQLNLPFTDEYDFRRDERNATLTLDLRQATALRSYQQKALSKMFNNGRAISGIIVLPCGAGKTLVGITATCTVRKSTIVFCNGAVPVRQWYDQFLKWTTIDKRRIITLTSKDKRSLPDDACVLITTYTMLTHGGVRNEETTRILQQIESREWGLMILDEVQEMPAKTFQRVGDVAHAHTKLGLTATLVREDEKIADLGYLIGPKLYEANWIDLAEQGSIARVQCFEVWCKMTREFYRDYLRSDNLGKNRLLSALNPTKFRTVERLIQYHDARGDKILVFSDIVFVLKKYAKLLGKLYLYGGTSDEERNIIFSRFRESANVNCIFISKIGDKAIDLPNANVLIQICSHFGARMQEAQRLGRILRAKTGRTDEYNAFFYTLVSEDTKEMYFSAKRQQFLVDQGYAYEVVQDADTRWSVPGPLHYETVEDQLALLRECHEAGDTEGIVESVPDDDRDNSVVREQPLTDERPKGKVRSSADLAGGHGLVFKNVPP